MSKVTNLKRYLKSQNGYKITNTHFKIGSKIHSRDFYYAKRLFQNSYYTARIALLLAIKIKQKLKDKNSGLTVVGYEMYSELLLSLTKKFLSDYGYVNVTHFVTLDTDGEIKHLPNLVSINSNIAIIIPIASTGSTSIKIENYIRRISNDTENVNFLLPHINVLLAYDESFHTQEKSIIHNQEPIIKLKTTWRSPFECKWCFEDEYSSPLFETDKSSLTPTLIFDYPKAKKNIEYAEFTTSFDKIRFKEALIYRKAKRNNEHFLFSTNTEILLKKNSDTIENWLSQLARKLSVPATDKIVIISPCHYSNTSFINLINDKLFNSSATIIHYQTDTDYPANFKLLNEIYLDQKNAKIFFVDDSLISGKSFFNIYDLYRYTTDYAPGKSMSGAIFLSNKSSPDIHKRVTRAAKNVYSFINVNLPGHPKIFDSKPLEHEIQRYTELSNIVLHDVFRATFQYKANDINGNVSSIENNKFEQDERLERHEKMFKATHKAYEFFGSKPNLQDLDFSNLLEKCSFDENKLENRMAMMKVLSQYPFLLYMPVRIKTFEWHKKWFNRTLNDFSVKLSNTTRQNHIITYDEFREFKFLIRRAVFLGNYQLLSELFLGIVKQLFDKIDDPDTVYKVIEEKGGDLFEKGSEIKVPLNKNEHKNVKDFHIFLLIQYVELIQKNSWCAVKIVNNLEKNSFATLQGKQFVRMILIESAVVLNDFYKVLENSKEWLQLYRTHKNSLQPEINKIEENTELIKQILKKNRNTLIESNKFKLSDSLLNLRDDSKEIKDQLINFLWVKQFICSDLKSFASEINLTRKTEAIFRKLKKVFEFQHQVGAFFIVTDGKDIPHLVYDRDSSGNRVIKELDSFRFKIVLNFLFGEKDEQSIDKKTIIEYENTCDNDWIDIYNLKKQPQTNQFLHNYKNLLMIRISDSDTNNERETDKNNYRTLGLMGFYSLSSMSKDILSKQLLMLIRKDIGLFISKHHKNDEFSALREAEATKRFAYLAGHGRQMIQKLAQEKSSTFGNVAATMEKLQYLFATKWILPKGNSEYYKSESNKKLIQNVFYGTHISKRVLKKIAKIGNEVYRSKIIENNVKLDQELKTIGDEDLEFNFSQDILEFICFELFINAKKNRFHFINGPCLECRRQYNSLNVKLQVHNEKRLVVIVKSTGPRINIITRNKINAGEEVKPYNEVSGLKLINKVIKTLDYENALSIESEEIESCCSLFWNIVKVELNMMPI